MPSARKFPVAFVAHTYGDSSRAYTALATWEADTDVDLSAVTTVDADSSGTTLNVAATTLFDYCILGLSTVSVAGQILTVNGVTPGVSLTVSAISGTIANGTPLKCGFVLGCYADASPYNDCVDMIDEFAKSLQLDPWY